MCCLESLDNAMEYVCARLRCNVSNKRGFTCPFHAIGADPSLQNMHAQHDTDRGCAEIITPCHACAARGQVIGLYYNIYLQNKFF